MTIPGLRVSGTGLVTETGQAFKYVEIDFFSLLPRWLATNGPTALIAPKLAEIRAVAKEGGFGDAWIGLRAFRHAAPPNEFALNPADYPGRYYPELRNCTEFCGERGFQVCWTGGDAQIVFPSGDGQNADRGAFGQHVNESCAALVDLPNALWQTANEDFKNGNVGDTAVPQWGTLHKMLRMSGRYGGGDPNSAAWRAQFDPVLDLANWHGTRDVGALFWPTWLWDLPISAATIKGKLGVPLFFDEELGADEVDSPGRRSNNPAYFYMLGLMLAWVDGVTMHSDDMIAGNAFRPLTRACHVQFFKGAGDIVRDLATERTV